MRVYPLSDSAARRTREIERLLCRNPIGERDTLIAGVCLAIQRPLLTANLCHFQLDSVGTEEQRRFARFLEENYMAEDSLRGDRWRR